MGTFLAANWVAILMACGLAAAVAYIVKTKTDKPTVADGVKSATDLKASVATKADALKGDVQTFLQGLGMDVKEIKGDFDAATAMFLNRALSHGVAKIVRPEDQVAAAKLYADAALLIAASGSTATTAA